MAENKEGGGPQVGFVGVGLMGHGMARNLVEKGFPLAVVAHRRRDAVEDLVARGAREAASLRDLLAEAEVLFLCVTSSAEVEALVTGEGGILAHGRPGLVVIDCSTSHPDSTLALGATLGAHGIALVDAPLARTPKEAWEGRLITFVGAEPALLERIQPLLAAWAETIIPTGGLGSAHKVKLLYNFVAMSYAAVYAEAFAASRKLGLDPRVFDRAIAAGGLNCGNYQNFRRYLLEGERAAHRFAIANCVKDLRYYTQLLDAAGGTTPMGDPALATYKLAVSRGLGDAYLPQLVDLLAEMNGLPPGPLAAD